MKDIIVHGEEQELAICLVQWYINGQKIDRYGVTSFANLTVGTVEARQVDDLDAMIGIHHERSRYYVVDRDTMIVPSGTQ